MAEVFAYGEGRVVKLDRLEWSGVSAFEAEVITRLAEAGLPVAHSHGVVTIDGRCGVVLDRVVGSSLLDELVRADHDGVPLTELAEHFVTVQSSINETRLNGLPDLVLRLSDELTRADLAPDLVDELTALATELDDGSRGVCHFDFHPHNVLVGPSGWPAGWVVIDWLTVATGPPMADLARTLVLWGQRTEPPVVRFLSQVRRLGLAHQGVDAATCDAWIRVVAGARLAEGFVGAEADWLRQVAEGEVRSDQIRRRKTRPGGARRAAGARPAPWPGSRLPPGRARRGA
jgi:aminoglycoside phosphotransferase (APT) family kinase protein